MLAARLFGLGTTWTSFHLLFEEEAAAIFDIPYKEVMQAASRINSCSLYYRY